jgi:hypothetical protein
MDLRPLRVRKDHIGGLAFQVQLAGSSYTVFPATRKANRVFARRGHTAA